jgi:ATP-dependent helicase HepA
VVDQRLAERGDAVADLQSTLHPLPKPVIHKIVTPLRKPIQAMITQGEQHMAGQARQRLRQAETMMNDYYAEEIDRLDALHRVNPYIRQADIDLLRAHQTELNGHLASSRVRLDAIRLLIGL